MSVFQVDQVPSNDYEEEYLWSCEFSGASKEYSWCPEDPADHDDEDAEDPSVKPGHRLLLKSAVLMPSAKAGEVSVVQVETEGYNNSKVITPIVAMRGGEDHQQYVDILIPHKATFKLIQGEGPVHLVGSHCVNFYGYRDIGHDSDDEGGETTDAEASSQEKENEDKAATSIKESPVESSGDAKVKEAGTEGGKVGRENSGGKKRKASEEKANSAEKKKKEVSK